MTVDVKTSLSLDEINALLTDIAVNGDGADKFRALKMLSAQKSQDAALPEPMSDDEIVDRLSRLIQGAGVHWSRIAFVRAFPNRPGIQRTVDNMTAEDIGIRTENLPRTLKQLYRAYPEIKPLGGLPKGYPRGGSILEIQAWCQEQSLKIELEKHRAIHSDTLLEFEIGKDADTDDVTEGGTPTSEA